MLGLGMDAVEPTNFTQFQMPPARNTRYSAIHQPVHGGNRLLREIPRLALYGAYPQHTVLVPGST